MNHNNPTRRNIETALEAQRWTASQAARPQYDLLQAALERAAELALEGRLRDSRRVLEVNLIQAIREDEDDAARALALELKPHLGWA